MAGVRVSLETDEVAAEETFEDFFAAGSAAKDFGRGKGCVEEEADGQAGFEVAKKRRNEKKVCGS